MPEFLEKKLRQQYGNNSHAIYGTLNRLGALKGSKITPKGRAMERKHARAKSRGRLHALTQGY